MIERSATVVGRSEAGITVEAERESGCGDCSARSHCGSAVIGKAVGRRIVRMELPGNHPVRVGDRVVVGLPERDMLRSASLVYLLPLLLMFLGGVLGDGLAAANGQSSELPALVAALLGLLLGLVAAGRLARSRCPDAASGARLLRPDH